ncbi:hypothetical protein QBC33DRAFT_255118 [Phialemonium atrogriseum]|uniref:C2H2-type domain-containing protein n=1 Tax=Phialemonium atrogriseum TaxID=1093897 RepID=A0AAJ0BRI7_9PEZI|nr:uncharacterized protein QBC33DRAFT_255118 [Phialemonium atrogriseum]KAK1762961.1 hypothetical protein QBC33DRAFT_255118 [Phialemonium atrogriseum]
MDNRKRGQPNIPGNTMSPLPSGIPAMSFNRFDGVEFDDMEFDFYSQPTMMERTDSGTTTLSGGTTFSEDSGYGSQPACSSYYYYSPQNAGYYGDNNTYHQYDDQTQQQQEQYVTGTGSQYEASHAAPGPGGQAQQYTTTPEGTYIQFKEEDFFAAAAEIHASGVAPFYGQDQPGQSQYTAAAAAQTPPTISGGYRSARYAGTSPTAASPAAQANPSPSPGRADGNLSSLGSTRAGTAAAEAAAAAAAAASQAGKFPCLFANCPSKAFGRAADLDRHLKMVHFKETHRGTPCDYRRCGRRRQPFHRLDHFRDHLREFHKEDLPRRGQAEDTQWWASRAARAVYEGWWRCNRCLGRVAVGEDGYVCPGCGSHCEVERQRVRGLPVGCDHGGECGGAEFYRHDHLRAHLRECHGEDLPLLAQKEQNDAGRELDSEEWWRSRTIYLGWWRCNRCMARVEEEQSGWECPACSNPCEEERVAARTIVAQ